MLLFLSLALAPVALAATSWGSQSANTYSMQYDTATYGKGAAGSMKFCQAWRLACIDYVGALGYHHQVSCGASEPGPIIFNICAAVKKLPNGDFGSGPPCDFTAEVLGKVTGVTIVQQPTTAMITCAAQAAASGDSTGEDNSTSPSNPTTSTILDSSPNNSDTAATISSTSFADVINGVQVATTNIYSSFSASAVGAAPGYSSSAANPFSDGDSSPAQVATLDKHVLMTIVVLTFAWFAIGQQ